MFEFVVVILLLGCLLIIYGLPSYLARNTKHASYIILLNILFGWTVLGWVLALVWALSSDELLPQRGVLVQAPSHVQGTTGHNAFRQKYQQLKEAHQAGLLTQREFDLISRRLAPWR